MRHVTCVLTILLAVLAGSPDGARAQTSCAGASLDEARTLALAAAEVLEAHGPYAAFPVFADPRGAFIDRDLYVFVLDFYGRIWFNAVFSIRPGQLIIDSRDRHGRRYVREMIARAERDGEGWVEYEWINPCSGELEPKSAYIVKVGPLIVGVGAYGVVGL